MPKQKTKKRKNPFPILEPALLASLHRLVERNGAAKTAGEIGISDSTLYKILLPGQGMRPATLVAIASRLNGHKKTRDSVHETKEPAAPKTATISFTVEVTAAEALKILRDCNQLNQHFNKFAENAVRKALNS